MSNFTKDKWKYKYAEHIRKSITIDSMNYLIFMGSPNLEDYGEDIAFVHREADARLIAAAPKMYDTLISAMAKLRDGNIVSIRLADEIEKLLDEISGENKEKTENG